MGSLGVIDATPRCVPPYHSYIHQRALPFDALRHRFAEMARHYYALRLMWFRLAGRVHKVQVPIHGPVVRARNRSTVTRLDAFTIELVAFAAEHNPRAVALPAWRDAALPNSSIKTAKTARDVH